MRKLKRKALLLLTAMALVLVMAGGVALAATIINCTTNPCNGTSGDDVIIGQVGFIDETINALEGNDFVYGYYSDDTIFGGPGSDALDAVGVKGLIGGGGSDRVFGEGGADFIDVASFDTTPGSEDSASGGRGNDTIHAFDGKKDTINCGRGTRDHVYFDKGLDSVSRNCEKKHPNVAPPGY